MNGTDVATDRAMRWVFAKTKREKVIDWLSADIIGVFYLAHVRRNASMGRSLS